MSNRADSHSRIETPEGIELPLPLADPLARAYAFAIDFIIRIAIIWVLSALFLLLGDVGTGLLLVAGFFVMWGYYVIFEVFMNGSSPGKRAMKLRVVHDDFTPVSFSSSIIRNLLRTADLLPSLYGFGIISMLASKNNQRLGDIAAKTIVISLERPKHKDIILAETALAPTVSLNQQEQRRVVDFARFYETKSQDRANEIASHLSEALEEPDVAQLTKKLRRYAKWFLGERD